MRYGIYLLPGVLLFCFITLGIAGTASSQKQIEDKYWEWEIGYDKYSSKILSIQSIADAIKVRDAALKQADPFVRKIVLDFSKSENNRETWFLLKIGWKRIQYDNPQSAIERLTWAWFISPKKPMVYWGFASALGTLNRLEESVRLFTIAETLNNENQSLTKEGQLSRFSIDFAHSLINYWDGQESKDDQLLTKAEKLLEKPRRQSISTNNDCCCIRAMYSVLLFNQRKYKDSLKEYVDVKNNTPKCTNPDFEKELLNKN